MNVNNPFIHTFKTNNQHYFYDVNRNCILKVTKNVWDHLENQQDNTQRDSEKAFPENDTLLKIDRLKDYHFLSENRAENIIHPALEVIEYHLKNKIQKITLQVTQECNLRCNYCPYSSDEYINRKHAHKKMDISLAKKCINFLHEHSIDNKSVNIGFYGGEPLIEFELIRDCINYAKKLFYGKEVTFSITTNGTLLTEDIIEFLANNEVMLTISLDGPKDTHDKNRKFCNHKGTFDEITTSLQYIKSIFPDYYNRIHFNCVLDPEINFDDINHFFSKFELVKNNAVSFSFKSTQYSLKDITYCQDFLIKLKYEYFKFLLSKLNKYGSNNVSKFAQGDFNQLERTYSYLCISEKLPPNIHPGGPCIPGAQRLYISYDGTFMPCEHISEESEVMKIGDLFNGFNIEKVSKILNIGQTTEKQCTQCWAAKFCYQCASFSDNLNGLSKNKRLKECPSVKKSVENYFKDICVLKQKGYLFNDNVDKYL